MKKLNALVILLILIGVLGTGCGKEDLVDTWDQIEGRGTIIVGLDDTFVPMGFKDSNGNLIGFDVDLAKEAIKRLGLEPKFQPIDWNLKEQELISGNIDLIWNGYTIEALEKAQVIDSFKDGQVILFDTFNEAFMDLEAKRIDALVADEIMARYYIAERGEEKYKILDEDFGDEEYGIGVRKGDKTLLDKLNAVLEEMKKDGTAKKISEDWFGEDIVK